MPRRKLAWRRQSGLVILLGGVAVSAMATLATAAPAAPNLPREVDGVFLGQACQAAAMALRQRYPVFAAEPAGAGVQRFRFGMGAPQHQVWCDQRGVQAIRYRLPLPSLDFREAERTFYRAWGPPESQTGTSAGRTHEWTWQGAGSRLVVIGEHRPDGQYVYDALYLRVSPQEDEAKRVRGAERRAQLRKELFAGWNGKAGIPSGWQSVYLYMPCEEAHLRPPIATEGGPASPPPGDPAGGADTAAATDGGAGSPTPAAPSAPAVAPPLPAPQVTCRQGMVAEIACEWPQLAGQPWNDVEAAVESRFGPPDQVVEGTLDDAPPGTRRVLRWVWWDEPGEAADRSFTLTAYLQEGPQGPEWRYTLALRAEAVWRMEATAAAQDETSHSFLEPRRP